MLGEIGQVPVNRFTMTLSWMKCTRFTTKLKKSTEVPGWPLNYETEVTAAVRILSQNSCRHRVFAPRWISVVNPGGGKRV